MVDRCPYCGGRPLLYTGADLYPKRPDLAAKLFWCCRPCDAYVGCHGDSARPLGTLAGPELRRLRSLVHIAFDPLWRSGGCSRSAAYRWLSAQLGIEAGACHVSMFDEARCRQAVDALAAATVAGTLPT